jgi:hypothetical protein
MALTLEIKVVPSSGRQQWRIGKSGILTCYLKSAPERGLANEELVRFLAKSLHVPRDQITILLGATSRKKVLKINEDLRIEDVLKKLGIEIQQNFLIPEK